MSVGRAAARLHVHPNTLRYRLARVEALTGARFDDPDCVCELWWALAAARRAAADDRTP
jgi:DNA-binding PucR family transcriptional regulator